MSRISRAFAAARAEGRAALVAFVEAGDPDLVTTARLVPALFAVGADVVELGIPFSDPVADGPVIQRASERALVAGGGTRATIDLVAGMRRNGEEGAVVLFSYFNPILAVGEEAFARSAAAAGVDGVLVTDLPPEEGSGFSALLRASGLDPVFLLAPSSTAPRVRRAVSLSRGFVYLVSRAGVTGVRTELPAGLEELTRRVRPLAGRRPVAVGFGISTPEQVAVAARLADGVVVGSALVLAMEKGIAEGRDPVESAVGLASRLAGATVR